MTDSELHVERGGFTTLPDSVWDWRGPDGSPLSARAVGVLVLMLSKPPGWRFSTERLAQEVREGRDAVRAAVQELENAGFVSRRQVPEGGLFKTVVRVAPTPRWANQSAVINNGKSVVGGPVVGGPGVSVITESQDREQEKTSSSRPAPSRVPSAITEIAREAEEGTVRKGRGARRERERQVDQTVSSGWPTRRRPYREPTSPQRCWGITERFRKKALAAYPDEAMQVSKDGVYKTLRKILEESPGLTWEHLDRAVDLFWETDAARLHHQGVPAWKNLLRHMPWLVEQARRELTPEQSPDEWFAKRAASKAADEAMTEEEIDAWMARRQAARAR